MARDGARTTAVKNVRLTVSVALLANLVVASVAQACASDPLASFRDDFKEPNPLWGANGSTVAYADGQLALKPSAGSTLWTTIRSYRFNNAVICLDIKAPAARGSSGTGAGLVFGKADNQNFYVVALYGSGRYALIQLSNNSWRILDGSSNLKTFNVGLGAVNEIKVWQRPTLRNSSILDTHIVINGDDIAYQAELPIIPGGGAIGVFAESAADSPAEQRFLDISASVVSLDPEGTYALTGADGSGQSYSGTVYVWKYIYKGDGVESYSVNWDIGGKKLNGIGIQRGNELSVSYTDGSTMGAAVLDSVGTGWSGKRVNAGSAARAATETWVRK